MPRISILIISAFILLTGNVCAQDNELVSSELDGQALATPVLISPRNGEEIGTVTPTLKWEEVAGADCYNVEICYDKKCGKKVTDSKSKYPKTGSWKVVNYLQDGKNYYWRVSAHNFDGWSEPSAPFLFAVNEKAAAAPKSDNIAVVDFTGKNISAADASIVTDFLRTNFVNIGQHTVVEKNNMDKLLAEAAFQQRGCTETECAVQIGRILNVRKMVVGSLSKLEGGYYITASIIDVETGKIETSKTVGCDKASDLLPTAQDLANQLTGGAPARKSESEYRPAPAERMVRRPSVSSDRIPRILDLHGKELVFNKGAYDMVQKRQMFDIYNGDEKIASMRVTGVDATESAGKILRTYRGLFPEAGDSLMYTGRKFKAGGIGLTAGILSGARLEGAGGGISYDFVSPSGFGFQISLTSYYQYSYGSNYYNSYTNNIYIWSWNELDEDSAYLAPVILKYHFRYDTDLSPYIGAGLYYNSTYSNYYESYSETDYNIWPYPTTSTSGYVWSEENSGISPVFNIGIELFAKRLCHLSLDAKYFFGKSTPHFDADAFVLSPNVSFNW